MIPLDLVYFSLNVAYWMFALLFLLPIKFIDKIAGTKIFDCIHNRMQKAEEKLT